MFPLRIVGGFTSQPIIEVVEIMTTAGAPVTGLGQPGILLSPATVTPANTGGALPNGTYYLWITATTAPGTAGATGETPVNATTISPAAITGSNAGTITITPASQSGLFIGGYNVYINTVNNSTTARYHSSWAVDQTATISSYPGSGAAPPTVNTAAPHGFWASYTRWNAGVPGSPTIFYLQTATLNSWTSGGIAQIDSTQQAGSYQLGIPTAAFTTGADYMEVKVKGPSGYRVTVARFQTFDKTGYSLLATTGLGNQTANITGNLSGSVGSVGSGVTVATNNDKTNYSLSTAQIAQLLPFDSGIVSGTPTTTQFTSTGSTIPSIDNSFVNTTSPQVVLFTSGALAGLRFPITAFLGSTKRFTVNTMPSAPAAGDAFLVI